MRVFISKHIHTYVYMYVYTCITPHSLHNCPQNVNSLQRNIESTVLLHIVGVDVGLCVRVQSTFRMIRGRGLRNLLCVLVFWHLTVWHLARNSNGTSRARIRSLVLDEGVVAMFRNYLKSKLHQPTHTHTHAYMHTCA